ncbi:hypothetical protein [Prevotella sp.]|uniref:hypothetical protein n=1 Tax=Prevotella sp. TaxID=59823 RepID=UPI0025EC1240|nr:hypothetical protein [Prevotella sp.]MCI6130413.1 hypothetical protein [Prevotella sp.]
MKKILSFVLAAVALAFTACSNDETIETSGNGQNNKGMVLVATVSQQSSRAAIDVNDKSGTWKFTFDDNDNVVVGNNTINDYYTFTKSGDTFSSTDAKVTSSAADWYAYYPDTNIDLTNQEGTIESAAKLYALAGKTAEATTGSTPLKISMDAKAAVLRIVKVDNYGPCDIYLKTKDGKFVSGLKANNNAGYDVVESDNKVPVFHKDSNGNAGIYYVIVPAGVYLEVWNEDRKFKTTSKGLNPGKYYTLTSGPTYGTATATINGETQTIDWVQMWIGGPRFAKKENVEGTMNWTEAAKTCSAYVWGANWRTPQKDEMDFVDQDGFTTKTENVEVDNVIENNVVTKFKYIGVQPGYTNNIMYLPSTDSNSSAGVYWSSTDAGHDKDRHELGWCLNMIVHDKDTHTHYFMSLKKDAPYAVRPVLTKETVLWGEQDIK